MGSHPLNLALRFLLEIAALVAIGYGRVHHRSLCAVARSGGLADPPEKNKGDLTRQPFQVASLREPGIDDVQLARLRQLPGNALGSARSIAAVPLLQDRGLVEGHAAAYLFDAPVPGRAFACQAPVADPDGLRALLGRQEAGARASDEL